MSYLFCNAILMKYISMSLKEQWWQLISIIPNFITSQGRPERPDSLALHMVYSFSKQEHSGLLKVETGTSINFKERVHCLHSCSVIFFLQEAEIKVPQ